MVSFTDVMATVSRLETAKSIPSVCQIRTFLNEKADAPGWYVVRKLSVPTNANRGVLALDKQEIAWYWC
jgi:hypothetical protein